MIALLLAGCAAHTYPDGSSLVGQLEREVIALNTTVQRLQADCGTSERPDPLFAAMTGVFAGTDVGVTRDGRTTELVFPVALLFPDPWSGDFRTEATGTLDLVATALTLHPTYTVTVEGHAADRAIPARMTRRLPDHLAVSLMYAMRTTTRLVADFGVAPERFTIAGRSAWEPIASNDIPAGQAQNERVVIRIAPVRAPGP
ncbi:MAG: OmpA family protein [Deltaproteobacteria bacterium]|nr:OmpA family protein [Deltaproteobacteria bacterium]